MTSAELAEFIEKYIHTFIDIKLLNAGVAYHYTPNASAIFETGRFLGAPINDQLDKTQISLYSPRSVADPGVVFAYDHYKDALEEGFKCEIIEINYTTAVRATHAQEATLGAPPTVLILNTDIANFKRKEIM